METIECQVTKVKWLCLSKCLPSVSLYDKGDMIQVLLISLVEEYKLFKIRLKSMPSESKDSVIWDNQPHLKTGRKWKVNEVIQQLDEMLCYAEVSRGIRDCRARVRLVKREWLWSDPSKQEQQKLQEQHVRHLEETLGSCSTTSAARSLAG